MGKDKLFRMDLLDDMENHFHGSIIVPRDSDINPCMCQYDQIQIAGTVDDMKKPGIIQVTPLIGRVQLDPRKPLFLPKAQLVFKALKIRVDAGERQDSKRMVVFPVPVKAVIYFMNLKRRGHDGQVDAQADAGLLHGSGKTGSGSVGMHGNMRRGGKNLQRARRNVIRENVCVKINYHEASIAHGKGMIKRVWQKALTMEGWGPQA
jgi:hypothetical protein